MYNKTRRALVIIPTVVTAFVAPVAMAAIPTQAAAVAYSASTPTAQLPTIHPGDRGSGETAIIG